jgi:hypothetical protein
MEPPPAARRALHVDGWHVTVRRRAPCGPLLFLGQAVQLRDTYGEFDRAVVDDDWHRSRSREEMWGNLVHKFRRVDFPRRARPATQLAHHTHGLPWATWQRLPLAARAASFMRALDLQIVFRKPVLAAWAHRLGTLMCDAPPDAACYDWLLGAGLRFSGPPEGWHPQFRPRDDRRPAGDWCAFDAAGNVRDRDTVLIPCQRRRDCLYAINRLTDYCPFWHGPRGRDSRRYHSDEAVARARRMFGAAADALHDAAVADPDQPQGWEPLLA